MVKLLSTIILGLAVVVFPPATLAFISQNAVPGDSTYSIKRKLEEGILAVVSLNPTTKAWFSINVTSRRFAESKTLIERGQSAEITLAELATQTTQATQNIREVQDTGQKVKLATDLHSDIGKYIVELNQVQTSQPAPLPAPTPPPQVAKPQPVTAPPLTPSTPSFTPSARPTPSPQASPPSVLPSPTDPAIICSNNPPLVYAQLCQDYRETQQILNQPLSQPSSTAGTLTPRTATTANTTTRSPSPLVSVTTCKGESLPWSKVDEALKNAGYGGALDDSQTELDAYNRAACPSQVTMVTCKGETKTWTQMDSELKLAGYNKNFDHEQDELDAYNKAACPGNSSH